MAPYIEGSNRDDLSKFIGIFKDSKPKYLDSIARTLNGYVRERSDYQITCNASVSLWKSDKGQNVPWKYMGINSTHHDGFRTGLEFWKKGESFPDSLIYGLDLVVLDNIGTDSKPNKVYIARITGDLKHGVYLYGMIGVGTSLPEAKVTHILDSHPAEHNPVEMDRNLVRAALEVGIYQGEMFQTEFETRRDFEEAGKTSYEQSKRISKHAQTRQKELEVILNSLSKKLGGKLTDAVPLFLKHAQNYARDHINSQEHREIQEIEARVLSHVAQKIKEQVHGKLT